MSGEETRPLPVQLTSFLGRDVDVDLLATAIGSSRLVTVTGPGGVGKTRLALESLARLAGRVVWVELGPVTGERQVAPAIAASLGLRQEPGRHLVETLGEQLRSGELTLALDNAEHLVAEVAEVVETLLRLAPGLRVVATSREPLRVVGETTWRVVPLCEDEAVSLFVARAAQVLPGYQPDSSELADVTTVCRRLDGLALAIELAAARLRVMSVAEIAASLDHRFRLLTGNARSVLPQQRTLEASVAWSVDLLNAVERRSLLRLAVFSGDFSVSASEAVGCEIDVLIALVDRSLVQVVDVGPRRFRLLETIRDFARARLLEAGESDAVRTRHAEHFLGLAEEAAPHLTGSEALAWLARLDAETHELEAALTWWEGAGEQRQFRRTVVALGLFWELRQPAAGLRWLRRATKAEGDDSVLWAQVLWQSAHMGLYADDLAMTQRQAPEALAAAERSGDPVTMARAATTATFCTSVHDPPTARQVLVESVQGCRDAGDAWGAADALKMTSIACLMMGDDDGLLEVVRDLRSEALGLGNAFFLAWCDAVEGYVALQRGDVGSARSRLLTSAELCRQVGDPVTGWLTAAWLADLDFLVGDGVRARRGYAQILSRAGASGGALSQVWALVGMAHQLQQDGDAAAGRAVLAPAAEGFVSADPFWRSLFCTGYGRALVADAAVADGELWLRTGLDAAEEIANPGLLAASHHALAELAVARDAPDAAEGLHHHALALRVQCGYVPGILDSLEAVALLPGFPTRTVESLRLLGATSAARESYGLPRSPVTAAACMAAVTAAGDAAQDALPQGAALSLKEAIAYCTRSRGSRGRPSHGWASLTPTELEVVRLVAEGLGNTEIGERMFIGRGTVKTHLAHVFAKLGVASRSAVAAEVSRRQAGSLPPG